MAKEMTDGDTTQAQLATGQQPDANDQLAIDPTQVGDTEGQVAADPAAPADEPMIPKSRLDQIIAKEQAAQEKLELIQQQMLLMQTAQQYAPQAPQAQQQPASADPFDGLEDDSYVEVAAARQSLKTFQQEIQSQVNQQIQIGLFQAQHPDYNEVVGAMNQFTGQFEYSPHLTQALTTNPAMAQLLQQQRNPLSAMQLAYQLGNSVKAKTVKQQTQNNTTLQQQYARNTAAAQTAVLPASAVGGGGEVNRRSATSRMSDAEFAELDAQIMSGQLG